MNKHSSLWDCRSLLSPVVFRMWPGLSRGGIYFLFLPLCRHARRIGVISSAYVFPTTLLARSEEKRDEEAHCQF